MSSLVVIHGFVSLGLVTPENKAGDSDPAEDYKPYHILSYANGPGICIKLFLNFDLITALMVGHAADFLR